MRHSGGNIRLLVAQLLCAAAIAAGSGGPSGSVEDSGSRPLPGAHVEVRSANGVSLARTITDATGRFHLPSLPAGRYWLEIRAADFQVHHSVLRVESQGSNEPLNVRLTLDPIRTQVSVTGVPGSVEELVEAPRAISVVEGDDARRAGHPTLGNALALPGVHLQQSTTGQVSPFLRGLTGFHVLHLVDGVRFNNSSFRFGPNQYLALLEPGQVNRVEMTLGPMAAEYGSDALGGAIHVVTASPEFSEGGWELRGRINAFAGSADLSTGSSAQLSAGTRRLAMLLGGSWRHYNDVRPGRGSDSRHVLRRLFGLTASQIHGITGTRLLETGFMQASGQARLNLRLGSTQQLTLSHQSSTQEGVRGYKDLWGGLGRLQSWFTPQSLNLFYARHQVQKAGPLDSVTSTFSLNAQRDGTITQGLRLSDPMITDRTRVDSYGYSGQARAHRGTRQTLFFGGEFYDEHVRSTRLVFPGVSHYRTAAAFAQSSLETGGRRVRLQAGSRLTGVWFRGREFHDVTFNAAATARVRDSLRFHAMVARGFRAPNINDLGTVGLQDLGFEVPAESLAGAQAGVQALIGASSGDSAASTGRGVSRLGSERLFNYEAGLVWNRSGTYFRLQVFDAELYDAIARRTVLFPASSVPAGIGGFSVRTLPQAAEQAAQGVVAVATDLDPRGVKAFVNIGRQRYAGAELLLRQKLTTALALSLNSSFLHGRDLEPRGVVRRLPPRQGAAALHYRPSGWDPLESTCRHASLSIL